MALLLIGCGSDGSGGHHGPEEEHQEILVSSSVLGSGQLKATYEFDHLALPFTACLGGVDPECLDGTAVYSAGTPGIDSLEENEPSESLFTLIAGTQVSVRVVDIDPGLSIRFEGAILDSAGDEVLLGMVPFHADLESQATVEDGAIPEEGWELTFELTTTAGSYSASEEYTIRFEVAHDE